MTKEITVKTGKKEEFTQEKLQEKLMLFQIMEKQMESMRQQGTMIEQRLMEIETSKAALREIDNLKPGNETLIPLGSGLYTRATITDKQVMTEVGAGIMKEKSSKQAIAFLEERKGDVEKVGKQLGGEMERIADKLQDMAPELQKMAAQVRGEG